MQPTSLALVRDNNISDSIAIEVRNMIVDGRLPAGERINEVHLSHDLGVSRTPLREALHRLAHEGALTSSPRIGYFVRALTVEEFEQIYPIRKLLDPEALRLAGLPSRDRLERLRSINEKIEQTPDPDLIIDLDDEWHLELVGNCPNQVLIDLIRQFIQRTRRYEIALMRERHNVSMACAAHKSVMAALRRKDLAGACDALRKNLETGYEPILSWLKERDAQHVK
ncbi:MAG TPA: GntR family transcriptional regulator [Pyrinomonadaceae bacterium]|nr:GntR family transcriptional regulator [Pyrinomonadaceae bacterium]